jgi:hypothetical protein
VFLFGYFFLLAQEKVTRRVAKLNANNKPGFIKNLAPKLPKGIAWGHHLE